jgi:hypothetical protein
MEQSQNKLPIFIGCNEPRIVKILDDLINDAKQSSNEEYTALAGCELAVINPAIQEKLNQQYIYSVLDQDRQKQIQEVQINEVEKSKALDSAKLLCNILSLAEKGRNYQKDNLGIFFNKKLIKSSIESVKRKSISNKEVDQLVEFLSIHNFINPVDLEAKPHLRNWMFTFTPKDLLENTLRLQSEVTKQIEILKHEFNSLDQNVKVYEEQISRENNQEVLIAGHCLEKCESFPDCKPCGVDHIEVKEPEVIKSKRKKKPKTDCCTDGACNCEAPMVTETEKILKNHLWEDAE